MAKWYKSSKYASKPSSSKARVSKKTEESKLRRMAKEMMNRQIETKAQRYSTNQLDMANAVNTGAWGNNVGWLSPNSSGTWSIDQGTTEASRIGNKIKPAKVMFNFHINPNDYDATANAVPVPQIVDLYIFSLKDNQDTVTQANIITGSGAGSFFDVGSSHQGFQGNIVDTMLKTDDDRVTVHKRVRMKIGCSQYLNNTGKQLQADGFANNDFKFCENRSLDITKYFPKTIRFDDTVNQSFGRQVYVVVNPVNADGSANSSTTAALPLEWKWTIDFRYKDA